MDPRDVPIDLLVNAVLDGRPVDWDSAESSAPSDGERARIRQFRTLAAIAALHRESDAARTHIPVAPAVAWGSLRLLDRIGEGSFGEVYRAWDTKLAREVALKLLRHRDSGADWSEAFALEEGRLLARVRHPNVVTVFGADRISDRVGMWMEFIRGRTLHQVLATHGPLSAREATAIGLDLCLALSAVHRAGLLHRDVKAQNVMREDGGRIVLMDFGAGRERLDATPWELAGTPLYLAPEVFAGAPATIRSDIYSLGVLLYHLATGSFPVKGRTTAELRAALRQRRRTWLRDERPDLPDRFVQAVERAIEFDPGARYESVGAMEAALARIGAVSESTADSRQDASAATTDARATVARRSRRPAPLLGAAFAIAAGLLAAVLLPSRWRDKMLGRPGDPPAQIVGAGFLSSAAVRKVPFTNARYVGTPSLDGKLFSFADTSGNVVVADLQSGASRQLTTEAVFASPGQNAEFSTISPDNRFVAYTWFALDGKCELRVVDMEGQHPRVLVRSNAFDYPMPIEWSRDGKAILAAITRPDHSQLLALVDGDDGSVRPIKELGTTGSEHASLSPDGEFLVYDAPQQPGDFARDIFILRVNGTEERRLVEHPANDAAPVWTPDGRRVLFVSDRSSKTMDVWSVNVAGGMAQAEAELLQRNIGTIWLRGLTDTGSYFYYATVGAVDVYTADLSDGAVKNAKTLPLRYAGSNISSVWSPDGQRLAYGSRRGSIGLDRGSSTLAISDLKTGKQHDVVPAMKYFLLWSWAPDGQHILAQGPNSDGVTGNFLIDVDSGRTKAVGLNGPSSQVGNFAGGTFMPDGRLLFFQRDKHALLARNLATGEETLIFDFRAEGVDLPDGRYKMAPDGQTLAVSVRPHGVDKSPTSIVVTTVGGGPRRELVRAAPSEFVSFQDWMPDGQGVLFLRASYDFNAPGSLWRVSIHGGDPQPLGLSMVGLRDVRVNAEGTKITFTAGWPKNELWVLEHFLPR